MATPSESDQLSDEESADLLDRVERFRGAWKADGSTGLGRYLPSPGTRHRAAVLVQVIVADMELHAAAGQSFRVESYTNRFPADLVSEAPPLEILAAEYQLRHRYADQPDLNEYRDRFPARYDELVRHLAQPQTPVPPNSGSLTRVPTVPLSRTRGPRPSTLNDGSRSIPRVGELVATNAGNLDVTPNRSGSGSSILPNDTPYQLVRQIGSGAFGEVFEALAPGGIRVAVKRILRTVDHPASKSERDALEAIKGLSHPFLLKTNAYWVFDDRLVVVMELADGSLADRVEYHQSQGRIGAPPEELIPLFEQASEALDYLHSQNISHRDVKPENILILQGYAKVADFGLARPQEHAMTLVGSTVGTPAYMAPEMWQQKVSLQSDQYSLAATYVRARLGRQLFATTVLIDMASFHIHETPNLDPLAAPEQAVLLKALAKNPNDRFPTCLEFVRALRAVTLTPSLGVGSGSFRQGSGVRVALPPEPQPEPEPKSRRRDFGGVFRAIAVALTCAVTVGIVNWMMSRHDQTPPPSSEAKDKDKDKAVAVQFPVYADHWAPDETAGTHPLGEKHYHNKLTRTVAGVKLVAVLVYPTRPDDPDAFYLLQNKVTNRVFADMWNSALKTQTSKVPRLKREYPDYFQEVWRNGAENLEKQPNEPGFYLGVEGSQAGVPVLGVSLPEAMVVANELGGLLPTSSQWKKAVGMMGDDERPGPAGPAIVVPPDLKGMKAGEFITEQLKKRNLALGLTKGPWPVEKLTTDVSYCGVHQLVSNGQEWLGEDPGGQQSNLGSIPLGSRQAVVVGRGANERRVTTFDELQILGSQPWGEVTGQAATGFRVVLKTR